MTARAQYLQRADECLAMAKTANIRDQKLLLGIAETWLKLAEEEEVSVFPADFTKPPQHSQKRSLFFSGNAIRASESRNSCSAKQLLHRTFILYPGGMLFSPSRVN
jgi:hypothetical protein